MISKRLGMTVTSVQFLTRYVWVALYLHISTVFLYLLMGYLQ